MRLFLYLAIILCGSSALVAVADDDDDADQPRPGLAATYRGAAGADHTRLDEQISFAWNSEAPDPRLPRGPFEATWRGLVFVQAAGDYRLRAYALGEVRGELAGKKLFDATTNEAKWLTSEPVALEPGYHPLVVRFKKVGDKARLGLYWSGPRFDWEPLTARWLFHAPADEPDAKFAHGARLARALRCAACHDLPAATPLAPAPALDQVGGNLSRAWLADRLSADKRGADETRRMPHFALNKHDAAAVAAYLNADDLPKLQTPDAKSVAAGKLLLHSVGCLACHHVGRNALSQSTGTGITDLTGGGELSTIADKRPASFFAQWLKEPRKLNRDARMPQFTLSPAETNELAAYLATLHGEKPPASEKTLQPTAALKAAGLALVKEHRCAACHALGEKVAPPAKIAVPARPSDWRVGCLGAADASRHRPGYELTESERDSLKTFFTTALPESSAPSGLAQLEEHNCLACHARGHSRGLAAILPRLSEEHGELREFLPVMTPPSLVDIGDKLTDAALTSAIVAKTARRPWLKVRMPRFALGEVELGRLVDYFVETDRIPQQAPAVERPLTSDLIGPASSLVTSDGFGCTSCHAIGKSAPRKAPPGALGPDLSKLDERIRRPWYDRWMRDPARIVPQMEMPAVKIAVRGVFDDNLDKQLSAVWQTLGRPDFTPPRAGPLRIVQAAEPMNLIGEAAAITDTLEFGERTFVKPLVIGLPNRHNVVFDLASNQLAGWWLGDTARQRTRDKSWYWEAGGARLLPAAAEKNAAARSELALLRDGERLEPIAAPQYPTELDVVEHLPGGLRFQQRLRFDDKSDSPPVVVEQTWLAAALDNQRSGFRRVISAREIPAGARIRLTILPRHAAVDARLSDRQYSIASGDGELTVELAEPGTAKLQTDSDGPFVELTPTADHAATCELIYASNVACGVAPVGPPQRMTTRAKLAIAPGFEVERLPLSADVMPTGLAWRHDGATVVSSLEGRVWQAHDSDADGLEDTLTPVSDNLASPYGVAVTDDDRIDVRQ